MKRRVLIVSNASDLHADIVALKLADRGCHPFRINLDEFPRDFAIDLDFGPTGLSGCLEHLPSGNELLLADVGAVWLRKPAKFNFLSDLAAQEQAYASAETEHLLSSVLHSLDCFWISHPLAIRGSQWKGEQLRRAATMGFRIPRSLMTNNPDAVRRFRRAVDREIILKTMSSPSLCAQDVPAVDRVLEGLPTTRLSDDHLEDLDAVRELACLFQEYVEKKHELRVTVIGTSVFAAKIHSQADSRTRTDYRDFSAPIAYEATTLPAQMEARCVQFVRSYGLEYGALDLIVTPDDEYVFLENNPAGQFLFVEQLVPELKMTDCVADLLIFQTAGRY